MIREAVAEIEASWAQQLGTKRFAELRQLLLDVSQRRSSSLIARTVDVRDCVARSHRRPSDKKIDVVGFVLDAGVQVPPVDRKI